MGYPQEPGWKATDTETSQKAAESVANEAVFLRVDCMNALRGQTLTADEVAQKIGRHVLSVRPRMSELRARGLIVPTGKRRRNASGKTAVVWATAPEPGQMEIGL